MKLVGAVVVVGAVVGTLSLVSSALAAFPGANGLLAVQPRAGAGIVLVAPSGRGARRICAGRAECGRPRRPRWSPDGRALVFAGPAIRIIYVDGSCLNCEFGAAPNPAFEPSGTAISFIQNRHVTLDAIDGIRERSSPPGPATDAVWSAGGLLAVVRHDVIWAGRPSRLKRIGTGREPSWSPHGALIAAAQRGWIVIIGMHDRRVRRLVRGAAPGFSPDGRRIAYVAPDHRLMVVPVGGRHPAPRAVGNIRAVSVDWQPLPRVPRPGCAAPPGSTVLASSPDAVVTADGVMPPRLFTSIAYMGCLRADGRERLLARLTSEGHYASFVSSAVLAAPYAGLVLEDVSSHDADHSTTLHVFDLRTGRLQGKLGGEGASCPVDRPSCLDHVVLGSDGVSGAHAQLTYPTGLLSIPNPLVHVSCAPATTMCVALDGQGRVLSSTDPPGGARAWKVAAIAPFAPFTIDCPSTLLCVGVTGVRLITSTDPAADASVWTSAAVPPEMSSLENVSCPSVRLCLLLVSAGAGAGAVATTTNPTGGASAWSTTELDRNLFPTAIFCSAQPVCFISDGASTVLTSTNPTGGRGAWTISRSSPPFTSGTCPTTSLCIAVNGHDVHATTNPGAGSWTKVAVAEELDSVACPSAALCLAVGAAGALDISTNPASGAWTHTTIDDSQQLNSIACPSTSLCVAGDSNGRAVSSTNPTGGPSAWTPALLNPCADTAPCTGEQIQASDSTGLHSVDTSELPGSGPFMTGPTLTGDVLSWSHEGTPRSITLTP